MGILMDSSENAGLVSSILVMTREAGLFPDGWFFVRLPGYDGTGY